MLQALYALENPIQPYAWGSRSAIQTLLGTPASGPAAELWMGAHPKAPSMAATPEGMRPLGDLIRSDPAAFLGSHSASRFHDELPYLFKILAAAAPLSIQAHPDANQARDGFERENRLGLPLDAPERNYRDPHHKPECIYALTPFWVMRGFRPAREIADNLEAYCRSSGQRLLGALGREGSGKGLRDFLATLLCMDAEEKRSAVAEAVSFAGPLQGQSPLADWIIRLSEAYPGDVGVLSPLFIHTFRMEPGEAMFLTAGELHAYLEGVGIELMANSDNVLRGGLTPKHVAVEELLKVLRFESKEPDRLAAIALSPTEMAYPTPAEEFLLSEIRVKAGECHESGHSRSGEILLSVEGEAVLTTRRPDGRFPLSKGRSVFVPAATDSYTVEGDCRIFKASVPLPDPGGDGNPREPS